MPVCEDGHPKSKIVDLKNKTNGVALLKEQYNLQMGNLSLHETHVKGF